MHVASVPWDSLPSINNSGYQMCAISRSRVDRCKAAVLSAVRTTTTTVVLLVVVVVTFIGNFHLPRSQEEPFYLRAETTQLLL